MSKQDPRYEKFRILMRDLREERGVTQEELAEVLGKPQSYVSKYEIGERNIDFLELLQVLEALNFDAETALAKLVTKLPN